MTNEFEKLDTDESVPEQVISDLPEDSNQIVSQGNAGQVYDWSKAPEGVKAPPRIDLNGKTAVIKKADIILPPMEQKWDLTKAGDKEFKYCKFVLYYDIDGQQEFFSGIRVFKRMENDKALYSHPTITRDRKSQASNLFGLYADFKKKDIKEISLREFMGFLNSQPKVVIVSEEVENPITGEIINKNFVKEFVN